MKTNSQLQRDVQDELLWEPRLKSTQVGVTATDGVVTLSGYVNSFAQKRAAEEAALRVAGVTGVAEDIEVRIPGSFQRNDTDIAAAAVNALKWNISVPDEKIKVKVENGWVTLSGTVDWWYQSNEARKCVEDLTGVRGVTNKVVVSPAAKPVEIKRKIEEALERSAELQAKSIQVMSIGDKVTLTGTVDSWKEFREAERAAWSALGVHEVENKLNVQDISYIES
jgi:osmotically-inducible protein OsmY